MNKMMHDDGLSTVIDWQDRDASGKLLNTRQRKKMRRLRKWNRRFETRDSKDKNLRHALGEIQRMASALGVPRGVREIASMIYRRCLDDGLLPGRSIEGVSTAALYAATRMEDMPRSLTEMERVSRVGEMEIGRAYRYIDRELGLGIGPSDPAKYIPRFTADLGMSQESVRLAERLVTLVQENGLHWGKSPPGIAGAAIYMAGQLSNETPTQSDLADVTGMTEVTIRERYQDMINHFEERWLHRQ
jgi:transcription initiation factor TFIIB